ncbi:ATP-binding cassette domain-containing protein [Devosia sp.]|uniref:ATP-binding cassette domain-containing protein n=1 Tax=Devosia sp. TaxID=1871048 RepID=UPI001AD27747|nr:ATP-binding cassette domain-containing protein [Devosia sp.]MBN9311366.1 ATP-binding cassette domain-containing protein [Devosia sp.]
MLQAEHLIFQHPGAARRFDLSFTASPGEVTAISGQSGAGKSTLLDLVAGFLVPVSGTLTLAGRDLLPLPPEQRPVSILLQSETLFDHLTAARNLELGLAPATARAERDRLIAAALAEVGLSGVLNQRAATLSGGEKQRVALARTLLRNRPVLLLDEPFSALDDETRATIRTLVKSLTERHGWITLLVSHHLDDIEALARRRYRLVDGKLTEA